jgi:hypothetical protein
LRCVSGCPPLGHLREEGQTSRGVSPEIGSQASRCVFFFRLVQREACVGCLRLAWFRLGLSSSGLWVSAPLYRRSSKPTSLAAQVEQLFRLNLDYPNLYVTYLPR